jgi:hypothetical protein
LDLLMFYSFCFCLLHKVLIGIALSYLPPSRNT